MLMKDNTAGRNASVLYEMFNVMVTLGTPDQGTCRKVSQNIGLLQAPDCTFMYLV